MSKKTGFKNEHIMIPDTQLRPGVPHDHIVACGNYICDKKPETIVIIGDWWDLPSLNSYEKPGSSFFEGVNFAEDIEFPNFVMDEFLKPIKKLGKKGYHPRLVFTEGNHEYRLQRLIDSDPVKYRGVYGRHMFNLKERGFEVHPFLDIVTIDGIMYSHYFCNPRHVPHVCTIHRANSSGLAVPDSPPRVGRTLRRQALVCVSHQVGTASLLCGLAGVPD